MAHLKVRGFVVREVPVGETDRIISILTAEQGLLTASARRSRSPKGSQLLSTQPFSLSDFELFCSKGHYSVVSAELVQAFLALHQDLRRQICAAHLAEVLADACRDDVAQPALYRLWAYALQGLQTSEDPYLLVHVAQLRLLAEIGLAPRLDRCVICGQPASLWFSVRACGLVCSQTECRLASQDARPVSEGVRNCLQHSLEAPLARLFLCTASPGVRQPFCELASHYLGLHMDKAYNRLNMLADLENFAF